MQQNCTYVHFFLQSPSVFPIILVFMLFLCLSLLYASSSFAEDLDAFRKLFHASLTLTHGPTTRGLEEIALTPTKIDHLCQDERAEARIYCGFLEYHGIGFKRDPIHAAQKLIIVLRRISKRPLCPNLFQTPEERLYLAVHGCVLIGALLYAKNDEDFDMLLPKFKEIFPAIRGFLGPNWIFKDLTVVVLDRLNTYTSTWTPYLEALRDELSLTLAILGGSYQQDYSKIVEDVSVSPLLSFIDSRPSVEYRGGLSDSSESTTRSSTPTKRGERDASTDLDSISR